MSQRIFVSYSHHDAPLVAPVVRLLRATKGLVFLDSDSLTPGKRWRTELSASLLDANLVILFWCLHSSESQEVAKEYQAAVRGEKDVLPVLLDSTPVPPNLREFQWIDFRELARDQHGNVGGSRAQDALQVSGQRTESPDDGTPVQGAESPQAHPAHTVYFPKAGPARRHRGFGVPAFAAGVAVLLLLLFFLTVSVLLPPSSPRSADPTPQSRGSESDELSESYPPANSGPPAPTYHPSGVPVVIITGMLIGVGGLAVLAIRRRQARAHIVAAKPGLAGRERQMAETLRDELLRRLRIHGVD
jgi:hypothetical protein